MSSFVIFSFCTYANGKKSKKCFEMSIEVEPARKLLFNSGPGESVSSTQATREKARLSAQAANDSQGHCCCFFLSFPKAGCCSHAPPLPFGFPNQFCERGGK